MTNDDQSHPERSGSRWEPGQDDPTAERPTETVPAADSPAARTRLRDRKTTLGAPAAAAVAAGLVVVSGFGGFALGSVTGDDLTPLSGNTGRTFPGDHRGDGDGARDGDGDFGGRGMLPPDQGSDGDTDQGTDEGADEGTDEDSGITT